MSLLILSLVVSGVVCGVLWRRPDARAVASGAWEAGKTQAAREFRDGYTYAQKRLRAGDPSWKNPRRWVSWALATGYGAAQTVVAGNRIRRAAWNGARERYAAWKASQPVDGEVVEDVSVATGEPAPDDGDKPIRGVADCPQCGARLQAVIPADEQNVTVTCPCGHRVTFYRAPNDPPDDWDKAPSEPRPDDRQPQTAPDPGPEPQQEGTIMQTEATGLASYAAAHQQFATELRAQMSGSESLAASMANILAEHSDLIGDTAILQDLLNQAAGVAERIAERSIAVANN